MLYLRKNSVLREPLTLAGCSNTAAGCDQMFTKEVLIVEYDEGSQYEMHCQNEAETGTRQPYRYRCSLTP